MVLDLVDCNKLLTEFSFYTIESENQINKIEEKDGKIIYSLDTNKLFTFLDNDPIELGYYDYDYNVPVQPAQKKYRKIIRTTCQFCGAKLKIFEDEDTCKCEWCDQINVVAEYYD